ncbi:hypothetical protein CMsap09_02210 [Clavibacter michiganensis]|uniref:Uncharacterized protein n=1 Tax=Clavibacter michiganensis TaxID=28447 RepID=A0A251XQF9_9MICO|nr:hypothetical protein CMsap09_02210 [Clavibacter michiganensis]
MDDDRHAEIAELRRRVFGPGRDAVDSAALERLRELEGQVASDAPGRTAEPDPGSAASPGDGTPAPGSAAGGPAAHDSHDPSPAPDATPVPDSATRSDEHRPLRRRRTGTGTRRRTRTRWGIALPWAASLVVVAVLAAGITAWALDDDRATVAVLDLELLPEPDNATYLSVDTGSVIPGTAVAGFHGLTVARVPVDPGDAADPAAWTVPAPAEPDAACLTVGASAPDGSVDGPSECGAGSVAARVAVVVADDASEELRAAYPVGTTLLFEDEGGPVRVRVAAR